MSAWTDILRRQNGRCSSLRQPHRAGLAQSNDAQWAQIAIFVTVDESGGFYDSGFIQPVDFFRTGPRIPLLAYPPSPQAVMSATFIASIPLSSNSLNAIGC